MAAIINFKLCGVGVRKGHLFGVHVQYPLITISMLFAKVVILRGGGDLKLMDALRGLATDPDWMVKNNPAVLKAKLEAERAVRAQDEDRKDREIERLRGKQDEHTDELRRLRQDNRALRDAIQIVSDADTP